MTNLKKMRNNFSHAVNNGVSDIFKKFHRQYPEADHLLKKLAREFRKTGVILGELAHTKPLSSLTSPKRPGRHKNMTYKRAVRPRPRHSAS